MRVGMLARRVIVGELHANFVADALAPEIPVEVIEGHGKLPNRQKNGREERPRRPSSGRYLARNAAVLTLGTLRVLLDHATLLSLRARGRDARRVRLQAAQIEFSKRIKRTS